MLQHRELICVIYGLILLLFLFIVCTCFYCAVRLTMMKRSGLYAMLSWHLAIDALLIATILFYLIPTSYFKRSDIFHPLITEFANCLLVFSYICICCCIVYMAINRYLVVVWSFPNKHLKFTLIIILCSILFGFILTILMNYVIPCCAVILDSNLISQTYENVIGSTNYVQYFMMLPLNIICTTSTCFCYLSIFIFVRRKRTSIRKEKSNDIRFAIHFLILTLFHFLGYITFRVWNFFGLFEGIGTLAPNFFLCLNSMSTSLVMFSFDSELRKFLRRPVRISTLPSTLA